MVEVVGGVEVVGDCDDWREEALIFFELVDAAKTIREVERDVTIYVIKKHEMLINGSLTLVRSFKMDCGRTLSYTRLDHKLHNVRILC